MSIVVLAACAFTLSTVGTALLRKYALAKSVLDVPNDRSSHSVPTPRGGGVAIVIAFLASVLLLALTRGFPPRVAIAVAGSGLVVAVVGFVDDHRHIPARWRLLAHFCAAAWGVAWLGALPPIRFVTTPVGLGFAGGVLAVIGLVWLLNLYNFMDGIDGIAGVEALTSCLGAALLYHTRASAVGDAALPVLLAAAVLGFLVWNAPPAKIFMGDAGSGFLGIIVGVLALRAAWLSPDWLWSWIIMLGVFIVDATVTLFQRLRRGERVYEAHRSHAYQHAAARLGSHRPVTLAVAAINIAWLLPWALLAGTGRVLPVVAVLVAYAPLVWLATRLRAGIREG